MRTPSHMQAIARSEQNQRSSHDHEEKMLHHVGGEQMMIEVRDRRCDNNPTYRESGGKQRDPVGHGCTPAVRDASLAEAWPEG